MEILGWRLWDFDSLQFVRNSTTGEVLCTYGPDAQIDGGPFHRIEDYDGEPVLLGKSGSDLDRSIVLLRRAAKIELTTKGNEESIITIMPMGSWRLGPRLLVSTANQGFCIYRAMARRS